MKWFTESGCRDLEGYKALSKCFEQEHRGSLPHANFMRPFCQRISSMHPTDDLGSDPEMLDLKPSPVRRSSSNLSQMTLSPKIPGGDGNIVLFVRKKPQEARMWAIGANLCRRCHTCITRRMKDDRK